MPRTTRSRSRRGHRARWAPLVVAGAVLWASSPAAATVQWSSGSYSAYGTNPILCMWNRSGIEKVGTSVDMWGQTLLLRNLYCSTYDLSATKDAARVRMTLWTYSYKGVYKACSHSGVAGNSAGQALASNGARTTAALIASCGNLGKLYAQSEHWAWRQGAWRYQKTTSPVVTYP